MLKILHIGERHARMHIHTRVLCVRFVKFYVKKGNVKERNKEKVQFSIYNNFRFSTKPKMQKVHREIGVRQAEGAVSGSRSGPSPARTPFDYISFELNACKGY